MYTPHCNCGVPYEYESKELREWLTSDQSPELALPARPLQTHRSQPQRDLQILPRLVKVRLAKEQQRLVCMVQAVPEASDDNDD